MESDYRLCRREVEGQGELKKFCNKTITQKNPLNWCASCRVRLPLWPANEVQVAVVEVH